MARRVLDRVALLWDLKAEARDRKRYERAWAKKGMYTDAISARAQGDVLGKFIASIEHGVYVKTTRAAEQPAGKARGRG